MSKQFSLRFKSLFREFGQQVLFPTVLTWLYFLYVLQFGAYTDSEKKTEEYDTQVRENPVTPDL